MLSSCKTIASKYNNLQNTSMFIMVLKDCHALIWAILGLKAASSMASFLIENRLNFYPKPIKNWAIAIYCFLYVLESFSYWFWRPKALSKSVKSVALVTLLVLQRDAACVLTSNAVFEHGWGRLSQNDYTPSAWFWGGAWGKTKGGRLQQCHTPVSPLKG